MRAGRLKALANGGPSRVPSMPDVPTMNEAGFPFSNYPYTRDWGAVVKSIGLQLE